METSSVEDAPCCGGTAGNQLPLPEALQRVGSGASDVIDPEVGVEAESGRKLPSSQYKGVVPQPNGRWGAQIYEKHQRVWLGTFNEEAEAARAYDAAVQRFRGRDAITNFKPLSEVDEDDAAELAFLASRSKAEIVDMLRKHTYYEELMQSKQALGGGAKKSSGAATSSRGAAPKVRPAGGGVHGQQHLFDKAVTPSDVGKLNRLVIPKQHAEKYFPLQKTSDDATKGLLLNFEDACGKVWRFRYSYWNSSQSYVLTKGWSRFVKDKGLVAGDVVTFRRSVGSEKQLFIDMNTRACWGRAAVTAPPLQVFRLFGVDIVKNTPEAAAHNGGDHEQGSTAAVCCGIRKRNRNDMDPMASSKKMTIKKIRRLN